uniref:Uncharacterized protein n=1 Tax=Romanomermis culicivorax TaxID=13658 RepID=A0A915KQW2_ROMCU
MNPLNRVSETIHSGHFMASNVHELKTEDDEEIDVVSESGMEPPDPEVRPDTKDDKPVTFYKFGPITTRSIAIDISLSKLNKCIQIAYDKGKLTTPKWKNFKGLKLDWKDRIRLNNASIVEGMYWKRKLETVCAQYTRWRHFYFKHGDKRRRSVVREHCCIVRTDDVALYSDSVKENRSRINTFFDDELLFSSSGNFTPPLSTFDNDDDFTNWFTDTLFSSLNQPYMFPNPKQFDSGYDR